MTKNLKSMMTIAFMSCLFSFALMGNESLAPELSDIHLSLWDTPVLEEAFLDASPAHREGTVAVGKLGVDGGNKEQILKMAREIATLKYGRYDSLLIAHKDKLLFEAYYQRGRINAPHGQASANKSYLSLAVGRAIQMGYLSMADLDKPLVSFLKDLDHSKFVAGAESVTLHKALTMTSGVNISWEQMRELRKEMPERFKGQGEVQVFLENCPPISPATQVFKYKGCDPAMVMHVLDAVVPGSAQDFVEKELLAKMGITSYGWDLNDVGIAIGPTRVTSRDMIKWGILTMNKGKWQGEQLISKAFLKKSIHKIVDPGDGAFEFGKNVSNPGYGYFWWQNDLAVGDKSYFCSSVQGGGGQYVALIEELDLIVVATGHLLAADPDRDITTLQVIAEHILPGFIK